MTRFSLHAFLALAASTFAAMLLLAFYPSSAGAQRSSLGEVESCPSTMYSDSDELTCRCDATSGGSTVWGTDTYTDDSAICRAAVHAGVIQASGGVIRVHRAPGRSAYRGSTRHGVASSNYGAWERSIVFDDPETLASSQGDVPLCPVRYNAGPAGWSGDCRCEEVGSGQVWGTNPYTSDSAVCFAARHAGVIGPNGGAVRVTSAPGQNSYGGSTRNGVSTSSYGRWDASFRISAAD